MSCQCVIERWAMSLDTIDDLEVKSIRLKIQAKLGQKDSKDQQKIPIINVDDRAF